MAIKSLSMAATPTARLKLASVVLAVQTHPLTPALLATSLARLARAQKRQTARRAPQPTPSKTKRIARALRIAHRWASMPTQQACAPRATPPVRPAMGQGLPTASHALHYPFFPEASVWTSARAAPLSSWWANKQHARTAMTRARSALRAAQHRVLRARPVAQSTMSAGRASPNAPARCTRMMLTARAKRVTRAAPPVAGQRAQTAPRAWLVASLMRAQAPARLHAHRASTRWVVPLRPRARYAPRRA